MWPKSLLQQLGVNNYVGGSCIYWSLFCFVPYLFLRDKVYAVMATYLLGFSDCAPYLLG